MKQPLDPYLIIQETMKLMEQYIAQGKVPVSISGAGDYKIIIEFSEDEGWRYND